MSFWLGPALIICFLTSIKFLINESMKKKDIFIESLIGVALLSILIYTLRNLLFLGRRTFIHDHLYWGYPVFQFFAENIAYGHCPLWDPFSNGGEPFYPILIHLKLLDPVPWLTIIVGRFFTQDCVILYNWYHVLQNLLMVFGMYIVLRPLAGNLFIRLSIMPILLYSSIMIGSFRQPGISYHFVWIPFITYFLLRIVYYKDNRWHNWLVPAVLIGLNWQSYFFSSTWIFLLFFSLGVLFFRKDLVKDLFESKKVVVKFLTAVIIIFAMCLPNLVLMLENDKYVYPARTLPPDIYATKIPPLTGGTIQYESDVIEPFTIKPPYKFIVFTGTFSQIWDFIQMISPEGNDAVRWPGRNRWGIPSEAYIYLGLLPWAVGILGLVAGRHDFKKIWLLITFSFGLLMMGPAGGLHRLLYNIYPPLWFVRHTHAFVLFFSFSFLYFYVLGFNHIFSTWGKSIFTSLEKAAGDPMPMSAQTVRKLHFLTGFTTFSIKPRSLDRGWRAMLRNFSPKPRALPRPCVQGRGLVRGAGFTSNLIPLVRRTTAFILFTASLVAACYWIVQLRYPKSNYAVFYFILIFTIGWSLRKRLGKKGLYFGLIISHIIIVLLFSSNKIYFLVSLFMTLGIPFSFFLFARRLKLVSKSTSHFAVLVLIVVFSVALTGDLLGNLKKSAFLYDQEHPSLAFFVKTNFQPPVFPQERLITCLSLTPMRYLSLVYRQPLALSNPLPFTFWDYTTLPKTQEECEMEIEKFNNNPFEYVLKNKRWSSFLLLKKYFDLVHLKIPSLAVEQMFAVGKPLFQYKERAVELKSQRIASFLNSLNHDELIQLFNKYVLIDNGITFSLNQLKISALDYEKTKKQLRRENGFFTYFITNYQYDSFEMETISDKTGLLYWADGYDKNWHAYINGKEVPIYRANVNFKAVELEEGIKHIKFVYKHPLFESALIIFYSSLTVSLAAAVITRFIWKNVV